MKMTDLDLEIDIAIEDYDDSWEIAYWSRTKKGKIINVEIIPKMFIWLDYGSGGGFNKFSLDIAKVRHRVPATGTYVTSYEAKLLNGNKIVRTFKEDKLEPLIKNISEKFSQDFELTNIDEDELNEILEDDPYQLDKTDAEIKSAVLTFWDGCKAIKSVYL